MNRNEINIKQDGIFTIIEVRGELTDKNNTNELKDKLQLIILERPTDVKLKLVIDLGQTRKVDSAGLAVILQCHKKLTNIGSLKLANANEEISSLLEITHANRILDCHTSVEAAKQYF